MLSSKNFLDISPFYFTVKDCGNFSRLSPGVERVVFTVPCISMSEILSQPHGQSLFMRCGSGGRRVTLSSWIVLCPLGLLGQISTGLLKEDSGSSISLQRWWILQRHVFALLIPKCSACKIYFCLLYCILTTVCPPSTSPCPSLHLPSSSDPLILLFPFKKEHGYQMNRAYQVTIKLP